jgi:hypothetical protein
MTKSQARILELIADLPLAERREVVTPILGSGLLGRTFLDRMTPEQRAELSLALAEADRRERDEEADVFARLERKHGVRLG